MEISKLLNKATSWGKKYRYVILVLAIGVILMLLPVNEGKKENPEPTVSTEHQTDLWLTAESLEHTLIHIQGAGRVKVLLSCATGEQRMYQTDNHTVHSDNSSTVESNTVILVDASRNEESLVSQIKAPEYLGAVVVCQGAEDPQVRLAIADAVSKATGLGTDRISVLKMK